MISIGEIYKLQKDVVSLNDTKSTKEELTTTRVALENNIATIELTPGPKGDKGDIGDIGPAGSDATVDLTPYSTKVELTTEITKAKEYADARVSTLVGSSPETLDTLNELASALGNDANFSTTVTNQIATKANKVHEHPTYATTESVNEAISVIELTPGPKGDKGDVGPAGSDATVDLTPYSTTIQMNNAIGASADTKVDKITGKSLSSNDYTSSDKNKLTQINTDLYAHKVNVYDKTLTYTKVEVGEIIDGLPIPEIDLSGYYTKPQMDTLLNEKVDESLVLIPVKHTILSDMWTVTSSGSYEYTYTHNFSISLEQLDVAFYNGNDSLLMSYTYIDNNSIKILIDTPSDVIISIKKSIEAKPAILNRVSCLEGESRAARVDYWGKEHASIDDRLNEEFRFNNVDSFKGVYVEHSSNKGNLTIEDSLEGKTKDLVINGSTIGGYDSTTGFSHAISSTGGVYDTSFSKPVSSDEIITGHDGFNGTVKNLVITGNTTGGYNSELSQVAPITSTSMGEDGVVKVKSSGGEPKNQIEVTSVEDGFYYDAKTILKGYSSMNFKTWCQSFQHNTNGVGNISLWLRGNYVGETTNGMNIQINIPLNIDYDEIRFSVATRAVSQFKLFISDVSKTEIPLPASMKATGLQGNDYIRAGANGFVEIVQFDFKENLWGKDWNTKAFTSPAWIKENTYGTQFDLAHTGLVKSNCFKDLGYQQMYGNDVVGLGSTTGILGIRFLKSNITGALTKESLDAYLESIGAYIVYKLETPIIHTTNIPNSQLQLTTFQDVTHTLSDNLVPAYYTAMYPVLLNGTLSRLSVDSNRANDSINDINSSIVDVKVNLSVTTNELKEVSSIAESLIDDNIDIRGELIQSTVSLNGQIIKNASHFNDQTITLASTDFDMDFRVMEIEFTLEVPIRLGGRNMALRTPYDMAKIIILGGSYDRADMEYKLSIYVKRGRMTVLEQEELIALMDANDLANGTIVNN